MLDEFRSTNITWDKATSRIYSPVTANASDENGRKLVVQIVNSGQVEDLTGATLHLYWETRDKAHGGLDAFKPVDLEKGEFELSYTTGMLSNQGVLNANLVLVDTVGRVVSERFKITVTEGIDDDAIQSENSFSSLTQALIDVSNLEQNYAPRLNDLTAQLQQIATEKLDKTEQIPITQLSRNGGLIDESYLSTALKAQITGDTPISNDLAYGIVSPDHTNFMKIIHRNLFNKDTATPGWYSDDSGTLATNNAYNSISEFIEINPSKTYYTSKSQQIGWYDINKVFISRINENGTPKTVTPPVNAYFMRVIFENGLISQAIVSDEPITNYNPYGVYEVLVTDDKFKIAINDNIAGIKASQTDFLQETPSENLVDESKITPSSIVTYSDGTLNTTSGIVVNYFSTDFIPVEEGLKYKTSLSEPGAWYTSDKTFISGFTGSNTLKTLTSPSTASFLRITFINTEKGKAMVCKDVLPEKYISYNDKGLTPKTEKQSEAFANSIKPYLVSDEFRFTEWNSIGDSITEVNSTATIKYHDIIKNKKGIKVNNYGLSGTGYLQVFNENKAIWDRLDQLNPSADLITVFAGTNDINKTLGTFGDTGTTTIYGGIDTVLQNLISKFPTKTIAVFTPLPRDNDWGSGSAGTTLEEIADAIIKVAGKYSIPVLDLYRNSNLHPWDSTFKTAMMPDGLHPNNAGHDKIADKIYAFLKKL